MIKCFKMKHSITSKQKIDLHNMLVTVELRPDNDFEKVAINKLQTMNATDDERELVENYLHFNLELGEYSVLQSIQNGNRWVHFKLSRFCKFK